MGQTTSIEWTSTRHADGTVSPGSTFNPWEGCCKVSDGCKNCYADTMSRRWHTELPLWGPTAHRLARSEAYWAQPIRWEKAAKASGKPHRVFCASFADVFEGSDTCQNPDAYAVIKAGRERLWKLIDDTPHLTWQLLTKRPQNILEMMPARWCEVFPENVWIGTSVENQAAAQARIPHLLQVPAIVRFLSCEPLLEAVTLLEYWRETPEMRPADGAQGYRIVNPDFGEGDFYDTWLDGIDWVIVGGESGSKARPMHPDWARQLRDECENKDVPFFFKQWGEHHPLTEHTPNELRTFVTDRYAITSGERAGQVSPAAERDEERVEIIRPGKKAAGRLLDGRTWDEMPGHSVQGDAQ